LRELPHVTSLAWLENGAIQGLEMDLKKCGSMASMAGISGLRTLVARNTVTSADVAELRALPALRALYLNRYDMERLAVDANSLGFEIKEIIFPEGQIHT
jgi:hypothetical protein